MKKMTNNNEQLYTPGEETANAIVHIVGSHLGAAMIALLVWQAVHSGTDLGWKISSACIYGASVILLYSISGAYHAVMYKPAKRVLQTMDHMAIYFLIAGSYTPFCLQTLRAGGHAQAQQQDSQEHRSGTLHSLIPLPFLRIFCTRCIC